jgi:hypothetical protein
MTSIFDLKESVAQLPSLNQGTSKLTYEQVQPLRDVTGNAFPGGEQNYRWEVAGTKWWIPARSYMRMKCTVTAGSAAGARQPLLQDDIAPNMALMSNLFQSAEVRIADKTASRIDSYFAQVDAIEKRSNKSKAWLDSAGGDLEWLEPQMEARANKIASDGVTSYDYKTGQYLAAVTAANKGFDVATPNRASFTAATGVLLFAVNGGGAININTTQIIRVGDRITGVGGNFNNHVYEVTAIINSLSVVANRLDAAAADVAAETVGNLTFSRPSSQVIQKNSFDVVWQPPLSIFKIQSGLPSGRYQLTLQPQDVSSYKKRAIETLLSDKVVGNAAGQFDFNVDELHLYVSTVEGPRVENITYFLSLDETRCQPQDVNPGINLQQKNYDCSPSAYALSVGFQDRAAGVDTRRSASKFKMQSKGTFDDGTLAVERLFVLYSGQNKPSPDGDWEFSANKNTYEQAYAETMLYNGGYYDPGAPESFKDWIDRGHYHYYSWPRDGDDRSTRVAVNYKFSENPGNDATVLLFDHYKRILTVQVSDGRVVDIIEQDA